MAKKPLRKHVSAREQLKDYDIPFSDLMATIKGKLTQPVGKQSAIDMIVIKYLPKLVGAVREIGEVESVTNLFGAAIAELPAIVCKQNSAYSSNRYFASKARKERYQNKKLSSEDKQKL